MSRVDIRKKDHPVMPIDHARAGCDPALMSVMLSQLDGTIDNPERQDLSRRLVQDPGAAENLVVLARREALLRRVVHEQKWQIQRRTPLARRISLWIAASAAAAILSWWWWPVSSPAWQMATGVIRVADGRRLTAPQELPADQSLRTEAAVSLFASGGRTRFEMMPETSFSMIQNRDMAGLAMHVDQGRVMAMVERQQPGSRVQIRTPHGDVSVVGTAFSVETDAVGMSLSVASGAVEVSNAHGGALCGVGMQAYASAHLAPCAGRVIEQWDFSRTPLSLRLWPDAQLEHLPDGSAHLVGRAQHDEQTKVRVVKLADWDAGVIDYRPGLHIVADVWIGSASPWVDVWLGTLDGAGSEIDLSSVFRDRWTRMIVRLDDLRLLAQGPPIRSRLPVAGERIACIAFQVADVEGARLLVRRVRLLDCE